MKNGNQHPVIFRGRNVIRKLKQCPHIAADAPNLRRADKSKGDRIGGYPRDDGFDAKTIQL